MDNGCTREKLNFLTCPTPFQEMTNLRSAINAKPRLFIKRDDLTDVGLGGNKNRKLDYVMCEARALGADTIVTWGGEQSNHARQTLAYAVKLGMECHIIVNSDGTELIQGNRLLYDIFGAHISHEADGAKCPECCEVLAEQLKRAGKKPYVVPIGASTPLGELGYIDSMREIVEQSASFGVSISHLFLASGSAGTQAGVEVGAKLYAENCRIHGVAVSRDREAQQKLVAGCTNDLVGFIGKDFHFETSDICIHDEYYGGQYGIPTKEAVDAIRLLARTEAVLLDPVYTGKAMSGLLDLLGKGAFDGDDAICFLHTGGSPAIYNFAEYFR